MIVTSVSRTYWNRGVVNHRKGAKKIWVVYYIDENDGGKLRTMRVGFLAAMYYKTQIHKRRRIVCTSCQYWLTAFVKRERDVFQLECPNCNEQSFIIYFGARKNDKQRDEV